jgi:hypothetical protein
LELDELCGEPQRLTGRRTGAEVDGASLACARRDALDDGAPITLVPRHSDRPGRYVLWPRRLGERRWHDRLAKPTRVHGSAPKDEIRTMDAHERATAKWARRWDHV